MLTSIRLAYPVATAILFLTVPLLACATAEPAAVEPAAVEPAAVEPAAVELAAVEPAAVEPAAVELAAVELAAVELAAVELAAVELAAVELAETTKALEPVSVTTEEPTLTKSTRPAAAAVQDSGDLIVNGEVIPADAVRRELVYRLGVRQIEARKLEIFLRREIERRGLNAEELINAEDIDAVIESGRARMKEEFEGELTEEEVLANYQIDLASWRDQTRLALLFNKLFIPENPDEWPEVTKEALAGSMPEEQREMFMNRMREGFKQRQAAGTETDANDQQRLMFSMMLRGPIQEALEAEVEIKTAQDGLPSDLVMIIDGTEIRTDEIFNSLNNEIAPIEWERTRKWLAKTTAVRQALEAQGAYLDSEAYQAVWDVHAGKYEESFIPLEQLVLSFKRFPSMAAYQTYFRVLESYRSMIQDDLTDATLTGHLGRANRLMGLEQVDAEVILLSAYDFRMSRWKTGGWEDAKQRAIAVSRDLAAGEEWGELLMAHSDYWDPPVAASQRSAAPASNRRNRGKFGLKNRNSLLPMVDENDFQVFLEGSSVGDTIFFDIEAGSLGGPYKGAYGYYIVRVNRRVPTTKSYSLDDANHRESIAQDYLQVRFVEFAEQALAQADVKGL